ncbi:transposase family protein [Austwickia chelonae]|uniref:transposase family protein n=1 Tax=Austwickia chelonae TaxID=100225 RepID=UPI000E23326C|nr:transposase family protein [Austwickia chelonae]
MRYQSTTGLPVEQVTELTARIAQILHSRTVRPGRPAVLGLFKQVVLTLTLLRQNLNQMAVGDLFGVSQPTVSRTYRRIVPLIEEATCLHAPGELVDLVRGRVVIVDGTDVPTRAVAPVITENYSGKRHRHGLLIQVAATLEGTLLAVSEPVPGRRHDRRALTDTRWEEALEHACWIADPAYQGTTAITPIKRRPHHDLTDDRKTANRTISTLRAAIERAIAHLKNWKILATGYRARLTELPNLIRTITRLEFYRLGW